MIMSDDAMLNSPAEIWDSSVHIVNKYADTLDSTAMVKRNNEEFLQQFQDCIVWDNPALFKLSSTINHHAEFIKQNNITAVLLYDLVIEANGVLPLYISKTKGNQLGNILVIDFVEASDMMSALSIP
jgi:hypothetical protein